MRLKPFGRSTRVAIRETWHAERKDKKKDKDSADASVPGVVAQCMLLAFSATCP